MAWGNKGFITLVWEPISSIMVTVSVKWVLVLGEMQSLRSTSKTREIKGIAIVVWLGLSPNSPSVPRKTAFPYCIHWELCLHFYWNKGPTLQLVLGAFHSEDLPFSSLASFFPARSKTVAFNPFYTCGLAPAGGVAVENHWSELNDGGMPGRHVSGQIPQETQRKVNLCTVMRLNYSSTEPCAPISLNKADPCSHPCYFCTSETLSMLEECSHFKTNFWLFPNTNFCMSGLIILGPTQRYLLRALRGALALCSGLTPSRTQGTYCGSRGLPGSNSHMQGKCLNPCPVSLCLILC